MIQHVYVCNIWSLLEKLFISINVMLFDSNCNDSTAQLTKSAKMFVLANVIKY